MTNQHKLVVTILGTTGVGKTKLSIELAKRFNGEIINADAMQMYKGLDIATNKATVEEMQNIPHHLLGFLDLNSDYKVTDFVRDAMKKIEQIQSRNKIPIIVGGTNYYIQSLLWTKNLIHEEQRFINNSNPSSLSNSYEKQPEINKHKDNMKSTHDKSINYSENGTLLLPSIMKEYIERKDDQAIELELKESLHQLLERIDPDAAEKFHPNNHRRVFRSLQIFYETGKTQTEMHQQQLGSQNLRYPTCFFCLSSDPALLDERLNVRVDEMVQRGLVKEVMETLKTISQLEMPKKGGVLQTIGLKEFQPYIESMNLNRPENLVDSSSLEKNNPILWKTGIEQMKLATRQYARKQSQWIRTRLAPESMSIMKCQPEQCAFYVLDASDVSKWIIHVQEMAIDILEKFISKKTVTLPPPIDLNPQSRLILSDKPQKKQEWKRFVCPVCVDKRTHLFHSTMLENDDSHWNKDDKCKSTMNGRKAPRNRVFYGTHEWEIHLKTKEHRYYLKENLKEQGRGKEEDLKIRKLT